MTRGSVHLRALEPEDIDFLFAVENQAKWLSLTAHKVPLSRFVLEQYLAEAQLPLEQTKQFRFGVDHSKNGLVGLIDLYDFDPHHRRAAVAIVTAEQFQGHGYALQSLQALETYVRDVLNIHQLYAEVLEDNVAAKQLFEKYHYQPTATFKDWWFAQGKFHNIQLYQKFIHD
ncbi:MAG: GNAT family N-acetyltransferase [Flavobacteriaceae bacterium]